MIYYSILEYFYYVVSFFLICAIIIPIANNLSMIFQDSGMFYRIMRI